MDYQQTLSFMLGITFGFTPAVLLTVVLLWRARKPRCPWHGKPLYSQTYPVNNTTVTVHYCEHEDCKGMFFRDNSDYLNLEMNAYRSGKGEQLGRPSLVKPTNSGA